MIKISTEELSQLRSQLSDREGSAIALNVIQECEGYLEDAIAILMVREMGEEPDRSQNKLLLKCQKIICQEEFREELGSGLLVVVIETLSSSCGIPPGIGTAIGIYIYKLGIKKCCESSEQS